MITSLDFTDMHCNKLSREQTRVHSVCLCDCCQQKQVIRSWTNNKTHKKLEKSKAQGAASSKPNLISELNLKKQRTKGCKAEPDFWTEEPKKSSEPVEQKSFLISVPKYLGNNFVIS
jgi:hypothetical protein